ncbi:MAG: bifunctional diaminohydroxyphosphoribosylaminopyrimidine deaminase/5-amino-6-(5-phosphoribosylamino)uracil reductase RibD [Cyanobacteria bacterium P01_C01_bin.120]
MSISVSGAVDKAWMQRCRELASQAEGQTSPNPLVGSVIVHQGQVVGEGFHPGAGQPHAEVFALRAAGARARGATLYVNLEPCNHTGRTPPCTEAILTAGISRVVVGMIDPDPRTAGGGVERLRQAGIAVTVGVDEAACQQLNEAFSHSILHQRPFGILKYAMTLDGKIAATGGHSAWVTGPDARAWVHRLRGACDAIIVGGETVRRDNPRLTTHGQSDRNPVRVIMSRQLNLPTQANLWDVSQAKTIVFCGPDPVVDVAEKLQQQGVEVVSLPVLEPLAVLEVLQARGMRSVLWECGGQLAARALSQACVQKVHAFIAPKLVGGVIAPTPVGELGITQMTAAIGLTDITMQQVTPDVLISGYIPTSSR